MKKNWISKIRNFFLNNSFGSFHQLKIEMMNRFNSEDYLIKTEDNCLIDALLIKPKHKNDDSIINTETYMNSSYSTTSTKNLMIICGPNGASYEYLSYTVKKFIFKFF